MKRTILIIAAGLLALVAKAQEDTLAYHSFVQPGKTWQVHRLGIAASLRRTINYSFSGEDAVETINGKEYLRMHASWSDGKEEDRGLFREEGRKVYFYNEKNAKESLFYDFTLQTGDEFGHYKVVSTSYIVVNGEQLRTITLQEGEDKVTWIEGVGYQSGPLADSHGTTWSDCIAYVIGGDGVFFPFEIESHLNGLYGQPLVKRGEMDGEDINPEWTDMLQYELFPERGSGNLTLHVYGYMQVQCGPNNYVWCRVEGNKVSLQVVELEPLMDCKSWVKVDMYFPFFQDNTNIAVDSRGEHVIRTATYHPFVEEGKVWHFEGSNPSSAPEYYCKWEKTYRLEGDTVIGTFQCKKLYVTSNCPFKIMKDWYYGAFFEDGAQVFYIPANTTTPHLLYDFSCREGDNVIIDWNELMIQERFFVQLNGSAHVVIKWVPKEIDDYQFLWIEGIGDTRGLLEYLCSWNPGSEYYKLLSCEVKGKVIFDAQTFKEALSANDSTDISNSTYRPFIEDGKVWRTGINPGSGFVKCYEYRLYGDTIIDGKTCKLLGRSEMEASPSGIYSPIDTVFVGALYEEGGKVYGSNSDMSHLELLYDFASPVGTDVTISGDVFTIIRKEQSKDAAYKGELTYIQLSADEQAKTFWMEGVGGLSHPLESLTRLYPTGLHNEQLLSCYIGDEAIYLRRDWNDPIDPAVKKQWLDFTHTVKTKPKSPRRSESGLISDSGLTPDSSSVGEGDVTGEYSDKDLLVSLVPLQGPYTVTLTNAAGEEVYVRTVQTSNVVALNTDLTKYPVGTYTLLVENADEAYTATLTISERTAIPNLPESPDYGIAPSSTLKVQGSQLFDLSGRRLSAPPARGVYINGGKVRIVKSY